MLVRFLFPCPDSCIAIIILILRAASNYIRLFIACAWHRLQLFQLAAVRAGPSTRVPVKAAFSISLIRSFCQANCPGEPALNQLETKFLHVLDDSSVLRATQCTRLSLLLCSVPDFFNRYLFIVAIKINVQTCRECECLLYSTCPSPLLRQPFSSS